MFRVIPLMLVLVLTACARNNTAIMAASPYSITPKSKPVNADPNTDPLSSAPEPVIPARTHTFRGIINVTPHKRVISPCNSDEIFNLIINSTLQQQLKRLDKRQAYIEFDGQLSQSSNKKHRRPVLTVEQLHFLSADEKYHCQLNKKPHKFEIEGSDPAWRGSVNGNTFHFSIRAIESDWEIQKSIVTKGIRAFVETKNEAGDQLNITFIGTGCIDNKDNYWQYDVKLHLKNKEVNGCGQYPNRQYDSLQWLGNYAYSNKTVTIELQLADNDLASLSYHYKTGKKVTETGYWHPYGSSGLKLLLTRRDGRRVNNEFHFKINGLRLQAAHQWRDNKKYSFNNSLLILDRMTEELEATDNRQPQSTARHFSAADIPSPATAPAAIQSAVQQYFTLHKTKPGSARYLYTEYDLNGNHKKDLIVLLDWCDNSGCIMLVFENRGDRYKFISRTSGVTAPIKISRVQNFRWQSLLIRVDNRWAELPFNGISYPAASSAGRPATSAELTQIKLITNPLSDGWGIPVSQP